MRTMSRADENIASAVAKLRSGLTVAASASYCGSPVAARSRFDPKTTAHGVEVIPKSRVEEGNIKLPSEVATNRQWAAG